MPILVPAVITRILGTVEKLNETMAQLNQSIKVGPWPPRAWQRSPRVSLMDYGLCAQETNYYNGSTSEIVELWVTYLQNVRFNLASANTLEPPV